MFCAKTCSKLNIFPIWITLMWLGKQDLLDLYNKICNIPNIIILLNLQPMVSTF